MENSPPNARILDQGDQPPQVSLPLRQLRKPQQPPRSEDGNDLDKNHQPARKTSRDTTPVGHDGLPPLYDDELFGHPAQTAARTQPSASGPSLPSGPTVISGLAQPDIQQPVEEQLLTLSEYIDRYGPFDPKTAPFKRAKKPARQFFSKFRYFPDDDEPMDPVEARKTGAAGSEGGGVPDEKGKGKANEDSEDDAKDAAKTG